MSASERVLAELVGSDVGAVPVVARYLLDAGGKRLRPALTALGSLSVGIAQPCPRLMCCGELVHLGSLLHDDVVDDASVRRGRSSPRTVYGNAVSVLTGDFCVSRALLAAGEVGGSDAMMALARTVAEMSEGEVLQLQRAGNLDNSVDDYFDIIDRKSGSLIAWCASAGALSIGDREAAAALERFGRGVGRAFQIADDVLDYACDTGKTPGADLRERKVTLPLVFALERVDGLRDELDAGSPHPERLAQIISMVEASGALEDALAAAQGFVLDGVAALECLPPSESRDALAAIGAFVVERSS
jgi:octaprenyl-diphosphate synthase